MQCDPKVAVNKAISVVNESASNGTAIPLNAARALVELFNLFRRSTGGFNIEVSEDTFNFVYDEYEDDEDDE